MSDGNGTTGTYVLLGGTGGIGSEVARRLTAGGHNVVLAARDEDRLNALASEIGAQTRVLDATDPSAVEACVQQAAEGSGRVDGIANLVGSILLKPAHLTRDEDWSSTLATNLGTAFAAVRAAGRVMRQGGSVVLMSTAAARVGLPNHDAIAAAKSGVEGLARSAAATYAGRGLRFNVVAPGLVETPLSARIIGNEASRKASIALHPLGRLGNAGEVADVVAWLLGPTSGWVTGQVIGVDGGLSAVRAGRG